MAEENDALLKQVRRGALALINSYLSNQLAVTFHFFGVVDMDMNNIRPVLAINNRTSQ